MQPWPETLRKVGEKAPNSIDPVREFCRWNVRVAEQDHLLTIVIGWISLKGPGSQNLKVSQGIRVLGSQVPRC